MPWPKGEAASRIIAASPVRPRSHDPSIPKPVEAVCLRALGATPDARYPDANALADALEGRGHEPAPTQSAWLGVVAVLVVVVFAAAAADFWTAPTQLAEAEGAASPTSPAQDPPQLQPAIGLEPRL